MSKKAPTPPPYNRDGFPERGRESHRTPDSSRSPAPYAYERPTPPPQPPEPNKPK